MADNPYGLTGIPSMDLGLGGLLGDQQKDETEEQRRKRLSGQQDPRSVAVQQGLLGIGGGLGNPASRPR
jgi:hypothetical protein